MRKITLYFILLSMYLHACTFSTSTAQNIIDAVDLKAEGIQNLEVEGRFCKVTIEAVSGNTLAFDGKITSSKDVDAYKIKTQQNGSTLRVWIENAEGKSWKFMNNVNGELNFKVPKSINCIVDNSSGSVNVTGLAGGKVSLKASSGSVKASQIHSNAYFKTSSGSLRLNDITGRCEAESSSGSQQWSNIKGNINTHASSGALRFEEVKGDIDAYTSSGSISMKRIEGQLQLKCSSGAIHGDAIKLTASSNFKTSSGSINLALINPVNDLGFDLNANSGNLKVGDMKADDKLYLNRGNIKIIGVSSSGSQRYYN